jgi:hypothetical protein
LAISEAASDAHGTPQALALLACWRTLRFSPAQEQVLQSVQAAHVQSMQVAVPQDCKLQPKVSSVMKALPSLLTQGLP